MHIKTIWFDLKQFSNFILILGTRYVVKEIDCGDGEGLASWGSRIHRIMNTWTKSSFRDPILNLQFTHNANRICINYNAWIKKQVRNVSIQTSALVAAGQVIRQRSGTFIATWIFPCALRPPPWFRAATHHVPLSKSIHVETVQAWSCLNGPT